MAVVKSILRKHGFKLLFPFILAALVYWIWIVPPKYQGYAPDQPIAFSHKIHAGDFQIDCQFCHTTVEVSSHASVPDSATCMKCHQEIASDSLDIQYLRTAYREGIPIRWVKVHDLPDHARFSHKAHIVKGIGCQECHGAVETMEKVEVHSAFNMGWCVNCHRKYSPELEEGATLSNVAVPLTECSTCHF